MFKKISMALAVVISTSVASRADNSLQICSALGELAEVIMDARQGGVPMSVVVKGMTEASPQIDGFLRGMIASAYAVTMFRTSEYKESAKVKFRDDNELACFLSGIGKEGDGA